MKIRSVFIKIVMPVVAVSVLVSGAAAACLDLAAQPRVIGWAQTPYVQACSVSPPYVFGASNDSLVVLDASDPTAPRRISALPLGYASRLLLIDDVLFAVLEGGGVARIDVADAHAPVLLGVDWSVAVSDLARDGDLLVAAGSHRLYQFDVSDTRSPVLLGTAAIDNAATRVDILDGYAYVGSSVDGMDILDISDPDDAVLVGSWDDVAADDVVVDGATAYVANRTAGLVIVDVADPAHPQLLGTCPNADTSIAVEKLGDHVLLADYHAGLEIIDVSDPASPQRIGWVGAADAAGGNMGTAGHLVFVPTYEDGLMIVDVRGEAPPAPLAIDATALYCMDMVARGRIIFAAAWPTLQTYRLDPGGVLTPLGGVDLGDAGEAVALSGNRAYVAAEVGGLAVFDIEDPAAPAQLGTYTRDFDQFHDVAVVDSTAYVTSGGGYFSLWILDVADPGAIGSVGSLSLPGYADAGGIAVVGETAFVAANGLYIVDVARPETPVIVDFLETSYPAARDLLVDGDLLYVLHSIVSSGVDIYDIASPREPRSLATFGVPEVAYRLRLAGDRLLIAARDAGVEVVDVSDPRAPRLEGFVETPYESGGTSSVLCVQDKMVVAHQSLGLMTFPRPCLGRDVRPLVPIAVGDGHAERAPVPAGDALRLAVRPNPANPSTRIEWSQPRAGRGDVAVYDAAGRRLRVLLDGAVAAGPVSVEWNGRDESGRLVPSGRYFVKVRAEGVDAVRGVTVVR